MWLVIECSGVICGLLTYVIVLTVQIAFIRIGIWEGLQEGTQSSYLNFLIFQYHCAMIFWSHLKCMTTDPGVLPKDYDELDFKRVSEQLKGCLYAVNAEICKFETQRLDDEDKRDAQKIEEEL